MYTLKKSLYYALAGNVQAGTELLLSHHLLASSFLYSLSALLPTTFNIKKDHPFHQALYKYVDSPYVHNSHRIYNTKQMHREVKRLLQNNVAGKCMQGSVSLAVPLPLAPQTQWTLESFSLLVRCFKTWLQYEVDCFLCFGEDLFKIAGELSPSCSGLEMFRYPECLEPFMHLLEMFNGNLDLVFQE